MNLLNKWIQNVWCASEVEWNWMWLLQLFFKNQIELRIYLHKQTQQGCIQSSCVPLCVAANRIIGWWDVMNFPFGGENSVWTVRRTPPCYSWNRLADSLPNQLCNTRMHTHTYTHTYPHTACIGRADMALAVPFLGEAVGMKECRDGFPILWSVAAFDISSHQLQKRRRTGGTS